MPIQVGLRAARSSAEEPRQGLPRDRLSPALAAVSWRRQPQEEVIVDRWSRLALLTGVAFFALLLASFIVGGSTPDTGDSGQSVINFYTAHKDKEMVSAFLGFYA